MHSHLTPHLNHRRLASLFSDLNNTQGLPVALGTRLAAILDECMPPKASLQIEGGAAVKPPPL